MSSSAECSKMYKFINICLIKSKLRITLKSKKRTRYKVEAQKIFEGLLGKKFPHENLRIDILLHLVELLLDELKLYGEFEVLLEITHIIEQISAISTEQNLQSLHIEALLLQSKIAFFNRDVNLSHELIEEARSIVLDHKLEHLHTIS